MQSEKLTSDGGGGDMAFLKDGEKSKVNPCAKERMLKEYEERTGKKGSKRNLSRIPLWYFLHEILEFERCKNVICWENSNELVFTIKKPKELAILWGQIKNKDTMTYAKLARGIRYYYGKGVIEKYRGKRFSYQFIVSKKTSAILTQKKAADKTKVKEEKEASNCLKRKYLSPTSQGGYSTNMLKRSRSTASIDSSDRMSIGSSEGSSDNESEHANIEDLESLDLCLNDIFSDEAKMKELFQDASIFNYPGNLKTPRRSEVNTSFDFDLDEFLSNGSSNDLSEIPSGELSGELSNSPGLLEQQLHALSHDTNSANQVDTCTDNGGTLAIESIRQSLILGQNYYSSTGSSHIKFYDSSNRREESSMNLIEPIDFRKAYERRKSRSESDIQKSMFNEELPIIKSEPYNTFLDFPDNLMSSVWGNMQLPSMIAQVPTYGNFPMLNPVSSFDLGNFKN